MYRIKFPLVLGLLLTTFSYPTQCRADLFGGDVAILTQILQNAVTQLTKLKEVLQTTRESLQLMKEIHKGINDSLNLVEGDIPNLDPGLYREWKDAREALRRLKDKYGQVAMSPNAEVQKDTDRTIAEAIVQNNALHDYSREIDGIAKGIKAHSKIVSPTGAQKLTAQSLGVMLQVMNQSLRTQARGLKLQAQAMATQNRKEKEDSRHRTHATKVLVDQMRKDRASFQIPRF